MKKSLFLLAVGSAFALNLSAQVVEKPVMKSFAPVEQTALQATNRDDFEMKQGPKKNYANQVYYTRPAGSLLPGILEDMRAYQMSMIYFPAFSTVSFTNMCGNKAASDWYFLTRDGVENSYMDAVDENMDMTLTMPNHNGYYNYIPRVRVGADSYFYGEAGKNPDNAGFAPDSINYKSLHDTQTSKLYGWGSLQPNSYLFGSGYYDVTDGDNPGQYYCDGVAQLCPKPMGPLYVERIIVPFMNSNHNPLPNGTALTLQIRNVERTTTEDGRTRTQPGATILYEFQATADDLTEIELESHDSQYTTTGKYYQYTAAFSNKVEDIVGNLVDEPFVLNDEYYLLILGTAQDGVDVGLRCNEQCDEDAPIYGVWALAYNEDDLSYSAWYGQKSCLFFSFYGGYDYCEVYETATLTDGRTLEKLNQLKVSADGATVENVGYPELQNQVLMDAAYAYADATTGEINYQVNFEDMPDWVRIEGIDGENGQIALSIECDPLPEGETKRAAALYIEGHGYKSSAPIIILQGEAQEADAIENVEVTTKSNYKGYFNMAGQRVGKDYKGIVINNGKKEIKK